MSQHRYLFIVVYRIIKDCKSDITAGSKQVLGQNDLVLGQGKNVNT